MGIKLFLVLSIHVFHTLMGFTGNHMHVNVFLMNMYRMRVSKGHSFSDLQKNENQSSISVFRFSILKNNLENKISIYFKFIKVPTVFRARGKRKTNFETNFVFHFSK